MNRPNNHHIPSPRLTKYDDENHRQMIPIPDPELRAKYREPRPNDPAYMATRIRVRRFSFVGIY